MKYIMIIAAFLFSTTAHAASIEEIAPFLDTSMNTEPVPISSTITIIEQKVRDAAVKVVKAGARGGHGSGALVNYKGLTLVFTAQHVADGILGGRYYVFQGTELRECILVYSDELHDVAVLYVPQEFQFAKPLKFSPRKNIIDVGEEITYSGYPSDHRLMTFRGRVAGYEILTDAGMQILLHTHGWFGCSGSLVYDSTGDIIGVLWGIDVEHVHSTGYNQAIGNLMWVSPIQNLHMDLALRMLCEAKSNKHRACR